MVASLHEAIDLSVTLVQSHMSRSNRHSPGLTLAPRGKAAKYGTRDSIVLVFDAKNKLIKIILLEHVPPKKAISSMAMNPVALDEPQIPSITIYKQIYPILGIRRT